MSRMLAIGALVERPLLPSSRMDLPCRVSVATLYFHENEGRSVRGLKNEFSIANRQI